MENMEAVIAALRNAGMGAQGGMSMGMGMGMDPQQQQEMMKKQAFLRALQAQTGGAPAGGLGARGPNAAALYEAR